MTMVFQTHELESNKHHCLDACTGCVGRKSALIISMGLQWHCSCIALRQCMSNLERPLALPHACDSLRSC